MSLYNMEELLNTDRINYIRDVVKKSINAKSKIMSNHTLTASWNKFNDNYNSKKKLIKLYEKLKGYNESIKSEKDSKKEKKTIKELNNKIKGIVSKRGNYDIKALGDIFKKSKMYDLDYPIPFIMKRIIKKLEDEFDSNNKKYNLIGYIIFKYQIKIHDKQSNVWNTAIRHFHSDTMFISSKNIIKGYIEDTQANFMNHLEASKENSDSIFDKFIEIDIMTSRNKAIAGNHFLNCHYGLKINVVVSI